MASQVNPPRGMRDFVPAEKAQRERVLGLIRDSYRSHGFDEIETPVMEDSSRLNSGLGGDNEKLAFGILKRGLTADDLKTADTALDLVDLGLRFDLTVPLARFYATHRAELPSVFKAIQIAPVWRAERPQKGRYRQFVQCDIDIIGDPTTLAEAELITATGATLDALGLTGWSVRINDRRLLTSMLTVFGFEADSHESVLITIDKLDKIGTEGVINELTKKEFSAVPVRALHDFFLRPMTLEFNPFGERAIRKALPEGVNETVIAELVQLGEALGDIPLVFDPFLVRGMGYYTGAIFEVAHPELGYSLGGGGRYDGMIGRFLGSEVPAVGFSLGFERLVELVEVSDDEIADAVAVFYETGTSTSQILDLKRTLLETHARVRIEQRPKNLAPTLARLASEGFAAYAVMGDQAASELEWKSLG